MKQIYIFKTKFASDMHLNGKKCIIIKDYENGQLLIEFLDNSMRLIVYDNEIIEEN